MASRITPRVRDVTGSAGLGTKSIYYRRARISLIRKEFFLPFDDATGASPPASFGTYRVLHQIGSGVLGPVFRAYDSQQDRLVAIKTFRLDLVPEDAARLAERLRALTQTTVAHPAIVAAVDAGLNGSTPFVALEYAGGESLDVVSRHVKVWTLERALPVLDELAQAIDASWAQSMGHGALHPRDIFVPSGASALQVTGFGIGQALDAIGAKTPARRPYSAPERASGSAWDRRADVYSLGVIAHEMLSGHRPVGIDADVEGVAEELPPPQRAAVRKALTKAMADAPGDRFGTATEFSGALTAALKPGGAVAPAPKGPAVEAPAPTSPPPIVAADSKTTPGIILPRPDSLPPPVPERRYGIDRPPTFGQPEWRDDAPAHAETPFPWAATGAVLLAGLVLGAVVGYQIGWGRGNASANAAPSALTSTQVDVPPTQTDVTAATPTPAVTPETSPVVTPVAKAAPTGRLVIQSTPSGALVTVDGQRAGETPVTLTVPLGRHEILVARSGYVPRTDRVELTAKQPNRTLRVPLRKGPARDPLVTTGSVDIDSRPRGARVTVDGRALGSTPMRVPELPAGDHRVVVELFGYRVVTSTVNIVSGELTRLTLTLEEGRLTMMDTTRVRR
jgi:serine/threonine-protein kinase